jgi:hypothetical protein
MEAQFGAFMPADRAEGDAPANPGAGTQYIPATVDPSEEVWEHEKELYRHKQEEERE